MTVILSVLDPWDSVIELQDRNRVWNQKIAIPRRIPADCIDYLEDTINYPGCVTHDKIYANRECYYKPGILPPPQHRTFLKVVVQDLRDTALR